MVSHPTIWILQTDHERNDPRLLHLRRQGCTFLMLKTVSHLIQAQEERRQHGCDAVLLFSDAANNCQAAQWLRRGAHNPPVIAKLGGPSDSEHAALLRLGADWLLRPDDPPALLWAVLRAYWARNDSRSDLAGLALRIDPWALGDHAWNLQHDHKTVEHLSVSERALLMCLFEAPGYVASMVTLEAAVRRDWQAIRGRQPRDPNVRGVISQLRRRLKAQKLSLPIEALRNFGYIWAS